MKRLLSICIILVHAAVIMILSGCVINDNTEDAALKRIINLANSFSYKQIINEYRSYNWSQLSNPFVLMYFCEALVEVREELPSNLYPPYVPRHIHEFAVGYMHLLEGKFRDALKSFANIENMEEGSYWELIGYLEYALYTESISYMEEPLQLLRDTAKLHPSAIADKVLPYYAAWYNYYCGNFNEVEKILSEYSENIYPLSLVEIEVFLLVKENLFSEAEKTIAEISASSSYDQQLMIDIEAHVIRLHYGLNKSMQYIQEQRKRFPRNWVLELRYAEGLIDSGKVERGMKKLKELANIRPFDYIVQLDLVEYLLYYGEGKEDEKVVLEILKKSDYIQLPYYNLLAAKVYQKQGQKEKTQQHLEIAKKLYPQAPYVLWYIYNLAMDKSDFEHAQVINKQILELDPNDLEALVSLMKLCYLKGEWKKVSEVERRIVNSERYITSEIRDEVNSIKALGLAKQHKFEKANEISTNINDPALREKTIDEINAQQKQNR